MLKRCAWKDVTTLKKSRISSNPSISEINVKIKFGLSKKLDFDFKTKAIVNVSWDDVKSTSQFRENNSMSNENSPTSGS